MIDLKSTIEKVYQITSVIVKIHFDDSDEEKPEGLELVKRAEGYNTALDRASTYFKETVQNAQSWTYWHIKRIGRRKYRVQWRRPLRKKG